MLALTRPLRQVLATAALVLFSVVPTGYVAMLSWRVNQPGHVRDVEIEVGRQLGLELRLDGVRYPRPGQVVYRGVVLRQVEPTRKKELTEIARAQEVRLIRGNRELLLEADGLRLRGESPRLAMEQIVSLLQRAGDGTWDRVSLSARTCEVELGDGGPGTLRYSFRGVAGSYHSEGGTPIVGVSYGAVEGNSAPRRCELTLKRERQGPQVRTSLAFKVAEDAQPLPARVLDSFFDSAEWLGPTAQVWGTLTLQKDGGGDWEADFHGDLIDVDLATLVGHRFPDHRMTGLARLRVRQARWSDRWVEAQGDLIAGPGTISASLLRGLESKMKFRLERLDPRKTDVGFDRLGLSFAMTDSGELHLSGSLGDEYPPDAVIVPTRRITPMAYAPEGTASVVGLINTLLPVSADDPLIPATAPSRDLQRYLPMPEGLLGRSSGPVRVAN